jgi:hypothetical protein
MRLIPVKSYPPSATFDSFSAAIGGAHRHPFQPRAIETTQRLAGTTFADACWTDDEFFVRFSNELFLQISVCSKSVHWSLTSALQATSERQVERVGAEPVMLAWGPPIGERVMDRSALVAKRRGAAFKKLFVNDMGLLLYCHGRLILWFQPILRTDTDQSMLHVTEEE